MKKKLWTGMLAAVLALSVVSTIALAAEPQCPGCRGHYDADGVWASFVDENGDGVCDNFAAGVCGDGYGCRAGEQGGFDRGQGLRNARRLWHIAEDGSRVRCADVDGDGVCDTCGATLPRGAGFIDEDGDGVCDNAGSGTCGNGYCGGAGRRGEGREGREGRGGGAGRGGRGGRRR